MTSAIFPVKPMSDLVDKVVKPVEVDPHSLYEQIGIRSHGKGIFYKEPVTGNALGNKRVFWVEPGCLVINIVFAWEQAVAKTQNSDLGKIASHRFPMYRPKPDQVELDYLTYLFRTELGKHLLTIASPGGAGRNKTLGQAEFMRIQIPCPPVKEQKRIVEILSTWDRAIATTHALIQNSKDQKLALADRLLTGRERVAGFSSSWKPSQLRTLGRFVKGKGIARDQVSATGLPCVRYGEIYTHHDFVIRRFSSHIDPTYAAESQRIYQGDLLFTCSGETATEIGKCVAFVGREEAYAGGDVIILTDHLQDAVFLSYLLNSRPVIQQKARFGQGNSVVHISASNLGKLVFDLPAIDEQHAIAKVLEIADAAERASREKLRALLVEKAALVQQLLTGQRRVNTAEGMAA
jgi:type I restriction enzyme, S subunit